MKALILFVAWCVLLVLCWPAALLALVLFPIVWLLSLPLRLIGITVSAAFPLVRALLFLPRVCWAESSARVVPEDRRSEPLTPDPPSPRARVFELFSVFAKPDRFG